MRQLMLSDPDRLSLPLIPSTPSWFEPVRRSALETFKRLGWPSQKEEAWRYTDLSTLATTPFQTQVDPNPLTSLPETLRQQLPPGHEQSLLAFVNGHWVSQLSHTEGLPQGLTFGNLGQYLTQHRSSLDFHLARLADHHCHPFVALNTAQFVDGAFIHLARGLVLERPLHILYLTTQTDHGAALLSYPRTLIVAEANSQLTVVETYAGHEAEGYLTNSVTEVQVGANASVDHHRLQLEATSANHLGALYARQERDSRFTSLSVALGGGLVRNEAHTLLAGKGAHSDLLGVTWTDGQQHVDNATSIEHARPHCTSHELYKTILDGSSTGAFRGHILVRPEAQKTDAFQSNQNLLLSDRCLANTQPQLEIFADDVRCSHGATIGRLDEDSLFYLRSRGIDLECARCLLTHAFASEVLERVANPSLKAHYSRLILERMPQNCGLMGGP